MCLTIKDLNHQIMDGKHSRQILSNICLAVEAGQCIALMGDSGSGKTTLLNLISGLEPIQQGDIFFGEVQLRGATDKILSDLRKNHLAIIFQQYNLLSSLSVLDNIEFSARLAGRYVPSLCQLLTQQLDIDSLLHKYPATLSGGEMQRVAIARALSVQPQLLLADEPTGNLDENNSASVVELLVKLVKSHQSALLMVTHSAKVAKKMDQVYRLEGGELSLVT
ncbi:MAG: ABC transporter ATP-binding protein [Psychromonas sp.]